MKAADEAKGQIKLKVDNRVDGYRCEVGKSPHKSRDGRYDGDVIEDWIMMLNSKRADVRMNNGDGSGKIR